ncbi:outer membrane protein assembly factor BamD [Shinella sp. CPCC 101442]|uniref:outer membrane protein assembly factor BamD n=1 Tax=Shinella sp. CPCC 101442 TaxID=2932265 RepID=UPI002152CD97|nr:outer membrane protein assembly factor BamD [Shinella sp. CPCC 101442]MCR6499936.1 outer membrane protein assembly factor BamD [Shinella sp. CPCC 101442]
MVVAGSVGVKKTARIVYLTLVATASSIGLSACQSDPDIDISKLSGETESADTLYNQGLANLSAGKVGEANRKFAAVDRQNPFSDQARKALVMSAFTSYRQGQYEEAVTAGKRYLNLYPESSDAAYAQYIIGLAYWKQIPSVTQDQRTSQQTLEAMKAVIDNYPDSEYVEDAQAKMRFARDQLAGKEMQIGRYYLERKEFIAAVSRFRVVVETYPMTNQIEEALARLVETYYAMGLASEAQTAAAVLGHNYPDSQWYADSYKLLQSKGLEPRENDGSWISRAGKKLIGA